MRHDGIAYAEIEGFRPLLMDLHVPDDVENPPVVVWVHGGGFRTGDRRYLPWTYPEESVWETLLSAGVACATIDYRFTREATWPAQGDDVASAIRFLRENAEQLGIDATRVGTWGESAGGHLALIAAYTDPDIRATVGFYPLTDILSSGRDDYDAAEAQLIGGVPSTLPYLARSASPTNYVTPKSPPTLLIHGDDDKVLPASQSATLHERLLAAGAQAVLRPVPAADHCFEGYADVQGLIDEAVAFLRANLGLRAETHQGDHGDADGDEESAEPGADGVELTELDVAAVDLATGQGATGEVADGEVADGETGEDVAEPVVVHPGAADRDAADQAGADQAGADHAGVHDRSTGERSAQERFAERRAGAEGPSGPGMDRGGAGGPGHDRFGAERGTHDRGAGQQHGEGAGRDR